MNEITKTGRRVHDMGVLDLRHIQSADELAEFDEISDVGVILIPEGLSGALGRVNLHDVGSVVPIPTGDNVNCLTGQLTITAASLAAGDPNTSLVLVGQITIEGVIESVGFKEIRACGQIIAARGSEVAMSSKLTGMTGQIIYAPANSRTFVGEENVGREFLEGLPEGSGMIVMGSLTFEPDVDRDLLKRAIAEIVLMGQIHAPKALIPTVQLLTKTKMGSISASDASA